MRKSGSLGNDHNSTFVTSLMTSLISDAKYQAKLDEYWKERSLSVMKTTSTSLSSF